MITVFILPLILAFSPAAVWALRVGGLWLLCALALLALVLSVGGTLLSLGRMERRSALHFGMFMALGGIVAHFMGPRLWELYLDLVGEV
jgi:hypothetical protein